MKQEMVVTDADSLIGTLERQLAKAISMATTQPQGKEFYLFDRESATRAFLFLWLYNGNAPFTGSTAVAHGSYFFLLQKGIAVTNITHFEVLATIRENSVSATGDKRDEIKFFSNDQYRAHLSQLIWPNSKSKPFRSLDDLKEFALERAKIVTNFYSDFLLNTIVINFFSTSFNLHIPPSQKLNIDRMVFESGYIHSVGHSIYHRRADVTDYDTLEENLKKFIDHFDKGEKFYLVPYSNEFFKGDDDGPFSIRNGVGDVKISARKHHIGNKSILEVFDALSSPNGRLNGKVALPKLGNFRTVRRHSGADNRFSIFLTVDTSLRYSKTKRTLEKGDEQYLSCYAQFLRNNNVLHVFKERKPAWSGPITLPHTLSGSIANIVRESLSGVASPLILDPFCGSCTKLIDLLLRRPEARVVGLDREPLVPLMVRDNFEFFKRDNSGFRSKIRDVEMALTKNEFSLKDVEALSEVGDVTFGAGTDSIRSLQQTIAGLLRYVAKRRKKSSVVELRYKDFVAVQDDGFDLEFCDLMNRLPELDQRLMVYVTWRALSLGSFRFHSGIEEIFDVLKDEFGKFHKEVQYLCDTEAAENRQDQSPALAPWGRRVAGDFSDHIQIDLEFYTQTQKSLIIGNENEFKSGALSSKNGSLSVFNTSDSIEALESAISNNGFAGKFNAIVSDPPYGFNTEEGGSVRLEELYFKLPRLAVKLLAKRGVLCIVLPSQSRNGKKVPYYETKEVFVRQFLACCKESGREIVKLVQSLPDSTTFPQPPFWWRSDRGVSRSVLLFMLD